MDSRRCPGPEAERGELKFEKKENTLADIEAGERRRKWQYLLAAGGSK
jgi:hypothetical protein